MLFYQNSQGIIFVIYRFFIYFVCNFVSLIRICNMEIQHQKIKQRFGIIGNAEGLNRAIRVAMQVAPTDLSVLISGESGVGKEFFPQIIHQYSARKHNTYIAVNCGAIPEGTIDSELFGHEKGSFTGATESRKGYFEVADGGSIFLDEVSELPLATQVRLLRVLESGEFIRVGSSRTQKTHVRVVAASNRSLIRLMSEGKFREDLFYRLNTVPIEIPSLRDRGEDVVLLFRKFAADFADRYRMPPIQLTEDAKSMLVNYSWPGNIRQLKNVTEQLSVILQDRKLDAETLEGFLPDYTAMKLPAVINKKNEDASFASEREILYKILFDMRSDMNDLKKIVMELMQKGGNVEHVIENNAGIISKLNQDEQEEDAYHLSHIPTHETVGDAEHADDLRHVEDLLDSNLSLRDQELELIKRVLDKHQGKRKYAAEELGVSERTLYRKIKEYGLS